MHMQWVQGALIMLGAKHACARSARCSDHAATPGMCICVVLATLVMLLPATLCHQSTPPYVLHFAPRFLRGLLHCRHNISLKYMAG